MLLFDTTITPEETTMLNFTSAICNNQKKLNTHLTE